MLELGSFFYKNDGCKKDFWRLEKKFLPFERPLQIRIPKREPPVSKYYSTVLAYVMYVEPPPFRFQYLRTVHVEHRNKVEKLWRVASYDEPTDVVSQVEEKRYACNHLTVARTALCLSPRRIN